jgi:hypothetical protein
VRTKNTPCDGAEIIRLEYLEMPGLSLTKVQARRLWGLDPVTCDRLFDELVSAKFLRKTRERYVRPEFNS